VSWAASVMGPSGPLHVQRINVVSNFIEMSP
jgi:hypothetical protein